MRCLVALCVALCATGVHSTFQLGTGRADVTGPVAEIGFMGYANTKQNGAGLHQRLFARSFIVSDGSKRIVFVVADVCMAYYSVKDAVIKQLQKSHGSLYTHDNVMLTGTHTHSGPGGFSYHALYDITTLGFHKPNFDAIVNGVVASIEQAHTAFGKETLDGDIYMKVGTLFGANINRSPSSYLDNPAGERAMYADQGNTDKNMTLLRLVGKDGELGMVNWFAVHGTSMNNTNKLVSSDNKGLASVMFEKNFNANRTLAGEGVYVASFASTNLGDVSPRTKGAFCPDGTSCAMVSVCNGKAEQCNGIGPGKDMFDSTHIIASKQFNKAVELFKSTGTQDKLSGPVQFSHTFLDMEHVAVSAEWSTTGKNASTCVGAMGDSFAAGTTDGPGDFNFRQGTNSTKTNPFWNFIAHFLGKPSKEQEQCQAPKPILLATGDITVPMPWTVRYQPIQVFRIGNLFLLGVPGEFTTMAGRRIRRTTRRALQVAGIRNPTVIVAAIANSYGGYVATYEEYQSQRYEAASTVYGPHTLDAYQQEFASLAVAMVKGQSVPAGPTPPDYSDKTFDFQPGVVEDSHPLFKHFGDVQQDALSSYRVGEVVSVTFWGADPRTAFDKVPTFISVERQTGSAWLRVANDGDFETRFHWKRHDVAESLVTAEWYIPASAQPGSYRIQIFGMSKDLLQKITPYAGTSRSFTVSA